MIRTYLTFFFCLLLFSCGKKNGCSAGPHDNLTPTSAIQLSPANNVCVGDPGTCEAKDEDSAIMMAQDGKFYMSWMSNRVSKSNDDIYVMRSSDGIVWSDPVRVTSHSDSDTYPTLIEYATARGNFHMFWTRMQVSAPNARHVYMNSSADGVTWNTANEVAVTSGLVDDFVPHAIGRDGNLLVYFDNGTGRSTTSTRDIFLTTSTNGGSSWSTPVDLTTINSSSLMDSFAFVVNRPFSTQLMMVWVRYDSSASGTTPYLDPSTNLFYSTSTDGTTWTTPTIATPGDSPNTTVDSIPSLYAAGTSEIFTWIQGVGGSPHIKEVAVTVPSTYPSGATDITNSNGVPGYSARVTRTLKASTYIRTWVSSTKKVYYQVFTR